jgi:hypothetical protein
LYLKPDLFEALATAVKLTNFSLTTEEEAAAAGGGGGGGMVNVDSGAEPLLDKMWGLMRSHEKSLRKEAAAAEKESSSSSKEAAAAAVAEGEGGETAEEENGKVENEEEEVQEDDGIAASHLKYSDLARLHFYLFKV